MDQETEVVMVALDNDVEAGVEVLLDGGAGNVGVLDELDFQEIQRAIEGLARVVGHSFQRLKSQQAAAGRGPGLKVESGILTAALVRARGDASMKITVEVR